jgi:hypothetical protein
MEFIYDDKRICKKVMLFIKFTTLLYHFICLYIDFNYIQKNSEFIYYINTVFLSFCCACNNIRYEYAHMKIYGQTFSSVEQFNLWKKTNKFVRTTYFLNNFEIIFHILFFCMTIKQFNLIDKKILFYSISWIILYFYAFIYFLIIISGCIFCCTLNIPLHLLIYKEKDRSSPYKLTNIDTESECCICMDKNTNNWVDIPCGHSFHYECIIEWNQTSNTCPICRSVLLV